MNFLLSPPKAVTTVQGYLGKKDKEPAVEIAGLGDAALLHDDGWQKYQVAR
ncbi:hypothetical protein [Mesorhizobium sp. M1163]|uniref:hypothetical protein n=1 Tax=Mesorhizobium sp. M1163 TaxID=2957065 RepID=UPI003339ED69